MKTIALNPKIFILGFILLTVTFVTVKTINKYRELKSYSNTCNYLYEKVINNSKIKQVPEQQIVEKFSPNNLPEHNNPKDVVLREGNSKWGFFHLFRRHSPSQYIKDKLVPKNTTLFLRPDRAYIQNLIRQFFKSKNIEKIQCSNKSYSVYETNIRVNNKISRTYRIVIENSTNNIVTFYPTENVPLNLLLDNDEFIMYRLILYGK